MCGNDVSMLATDTRSLGKVHGQASSTLPLTHTMLHNIGYYAGKILELT